MGYGDPGSVERIVDGKAMAGDGGVCNAPGVFGACCGCKLDDTKEIIDEANASPSLTAPGRVRKVIAAFTLLLCCLSQASLARIDAPGGSAGAAQ